MTRWLTHDDGTVLWPDDAESGDPAVALVDGFGCDQTKAMLDRFVSTVESR